MQVLVVPSLDAANEYNSRAIAFLRLEDSACGNRWSDVLVDYGSTERYGILFSPEIAGAFTAAELLAVEVGEPLVRNDQGHFVSGNWGIYHEP